MISLVNLMVTELIMDGGWSLKDLCNLEATTQSLYSFWTSEHLNFRISDQNKQQHGQKYHTVNLLPQTTMIQMIDSLKI